MQGATSTENISGIRGWKQEDMFVAMDYVQFNCYSIRAPIKKNGISPTSMRYSINGLTHIKWKGPLTMLTEQEDEVVVVWCNDMDCNTLILTLRMYWIYM